MPGRDRPASCRCRCPPRPAACWAHLRRGAARRSPPPRRAIAPLALARLGPLPVSSASLRLRHRRGIGNGLRLRPLAAPPIAAAGRTASARRVPACAAAGRRRAPSPSPAGAAWHWRSRPPRAPASPDPPAAEQRLGDRRSAQRRRRSPAAARAQSPRQAGYVGTAKRAGWTKANSSSRSSPDTSA